MELIHLKATLLYVHVEALGYDGKSAEVAYVVAHEVLDVSPMIDRLLVVRVRLGDCGTSFE